MIKIAVVGTGIIGIEHLKAIGEIDELELVAVCDVNEDRVKAIAAEYGVPYFLDYKDIPEKTNAEAVILNLPHGLHCSSTVFFLEAGLHVLIEKPMANTTVECDEMLSAAKASEKTLAVGHIQRFFNANKLAKDYINSGRIGKLCMIHELRSTNYFKPDRPAWFFNKKLSGGGIVMNYGAHALDKFRYVTDKNIISVDANCGNIKNSESIEGHAQFFVKMEDGITATVTFSGYSPVGYETIYIGTEGAVKVIDGKKIAIRNGATWDEIPEVNDGRHMIRQLVAFSKLIRGEDSEMPDGEYGRAIIRAIEEIYLKGL